MAVLLGLLAALGFGGGDYLGGHASKRTSTATVLLVVQTVGIVISVGIIAVHGAPSLTLRDTLVSLGAGVTGVTGLAFLFRGLAVGVMGVVAPTSAVLASTMPVAWGLFQGERPTRVAGVGVVLAVVAVALIAGPRAPDDVESRRKPLLLAFGAGVSFGVAVIMFSEAAQAAGFWPLVIGRAAAISGLVVAVVALGSGFRPEPGDGSTATWSGVLDVTGNAALLVGFRRGLTSLVAPIAALYPATTVILARVLLKERMRPVQVTGLALALVGLVLISAG